MSVVLSHSPPAHPIPPSPSIVSQASMIMACIPWPAVMCGEEPHTPWLTMSPLALKQLLKSCPVNIPAQPASLPPPSSTTCTAQTLLRAQVCISIFSDPPMYACIVEPQAKPERDRLIRMQLHKASVQSVVFLVTYRVMSKVL